MLKHDTPDNKTALSTGEAYQLFQDWNKGNEIPEDHYDHLRGRRSSSLPNRRIFSVRTTAFKQPALSSLAVQPANISTIQLSTQSPPLDDKMSTILAFDEPNKLMKFATTIEKQVARPNKGSSGVNTHRGEGLWVTYISKVGNGSKMKTQPCVYVKRGGKLVKVTFGHVDFDSLAMDVAEEFVRQKGRTVQGNIKPRNLSLFLQPLWNTKAWAVKSGKEARLARSKGDPTLRHTRFDGEKKTKDTKDNTFALSSDQAR